jgi:hypothetical protein
MPPSCHANTPGSQGWPNVGTNTSLPLTLLEIQLKIDTVLPSNLRESFTRSPDYIYISVLEIQTQTSNHNDRGRWSTKFP